jgi:DHA1 family tetracycline resistance protein-like MFS transporter
MKASRSAAVGFIVVLLLIDMIGFGIIIPVMPGLIQELTGSSVSMAAQYGGWMLAAYAVTQFFCAPIIGGLSDRFGRRPVLLASLFGFTVDYLFLAFAPSIGWLFVGRVVAGVMGASFVAANAYIADISTPENRAKNFGLVGATFGLGFIIGPVIGGFLGEFGPRTPFLVTAGLTALNWLYGFFVLPESLPKEHRRPFNWKRANPVGTLLSVWQYKMVAGSFVVLALLYIASHAVQSNWAYYTIEKFRWTTGMVGISLGVVGLVFVVVQGGLIRVILPKLGQERTVYAGLLCYALGFILYAVAPQSWMMYPVTVIYCMGAIAGPALQGIMSGAVPANAQGELQGALASLMSMTSVVGPPLMNGIFSWFSSAAAPAYFPGAAMTLGAALAIISCLVARATFNGSAKARASAPT